MTVKAIVGEKEKWNENELRFINSIIKDNLSTFKDCLMVSDTDSYKDFNIFSFDFKKVCLKEFADYKCKTQRNGKDYVFPEIRQKYDLIIIDECKFLGSNTELTSIIKRLVQLSLNENGYIIFKSYFDPNLQKVLKKKGEIIFNPLVKLIDQRILTYDSFQNISSLSIYKI